MQTNVGADTLIEVKGMNKSFTSTKAISDVSLSIKRGEIRGLIGENGSGKSTLSSMITGSLKPDSGEMIFKGEPHAPKSAIESREKGIGILVQELGTINGLAVWENIFMGRENAFSKKYVNRKKMCSEAKKALEEIGIDYIDPKERVERYSFEDRKLIEVASVLYTNPDLLIIDETTTALSQKGREDIYKVIKKRKENNQSVIFISHDLAELEQVCDSVSILRDGCYVDTIYENEITQEKMRALMIGRSLNDHYYREDMTPSWDNKVVLDVQDVSYGDKLQNVSFQLHKGEILGIGGLTESGMHELCKVMFGALKPDKGNIQLTESKKNIKNPTMAIQSKIGYMPKDRDQESLFLSASIKDNIVLPSLDNIKTAGLISKRKASELADTNAKKLSTKMRDSEQLVRELSGGNKQKVVVAKWLANDSDIILMDCPTRGIDIGVKANIYALMEELKKSGKAIIMISEEMPELIGMSDRIIILKDGKITGEIERSKELSEHSLISMII